MEITDQDIFDFIKSRGIFTCRDLPPMFGFVNPRIQRHSLNILDLPEVWYNSYNSEGITEDAMDQLTRMLINKLVELGETSYFRGRVLGIIRRRKSKNPFRWK